jgi:hypothetical protein
VKVAWRVAVMAAGAVTGLVLAGCTAGPVATPSVPATAATPTVAPGPRLTATQFEQFLKLGKLGTQTVALKSFPKSSGSDPDGEGSENQSQSRALSCVKMNKVADAEVVSQAADDAGGAVVQLFTSVEVANELFELNQKCAAEEAKLDAGTAVTPVDAGTEGSARWWLTKDPEGVYQVSIFYGNVSVFLIVANADKPIALVNGFAAQVDQIAK